MADVPVPGMTIDIPEPLLGLVRACETVCHHECCGADAFDVDERPIIPWIREHGLGATWLALDQFLDLHHAVMGHSGWVQVGIDGYYMSWSVADVGLGFLRDFPREVLRAVRGATGRRVMINPDWRTSTVVALAEGIYADRAFDRLPVLADALEDAGCCQPDILGHLRGPGPHARGCWVVDLILGKA